MLDKVKSDIYACGRCGLCVIGYYGEVCPAYKYSGKFDSAAARGRNAINRAIMEGEFGIDEDVVANNYTCLGCKACQVTCQKRDHAGQLMIDEAKITQEMRKEIFKAGLEPEVLQKVDGVIADSGNPFGYEPVKRDAWAKGLDLPKTGDVVYFAGCYAALRKTNIAKSTVEILRAGGIDVAYLGEDEWCCGVPQLNDGNQDLAEKMIENNLNAIKASGAKTVITSCAGCFHALKTEYAEIVGELPFEVKHSSEVIAEMIEDGRLKLTGDLGAAVTYHDPCHLGRHEGVYEAPRKVIAAIPGAAFSEMERNQANSWCCGGGSVVSNVFPEMTKNISADRIEEAKAAGAQLVISTCPSCEENLGGAGRKQKVKVEDLNVIVAKMIDKSNSGKADNAEFKAGDLNVAAEDIMRGR